MSIYEKIHDMYELFELYNIDENKMDEYICENYSTNETKKTISELDELIEIINKSIDYEGA